MATIELTATKKDQVAEKIKKVQELYADAPEIGKVALIECLLEQRDRNENRRLRDLCRLQAEASE